MFEKSIFVNILLFLLIFGFIMQVLGVLPGPFNNYLGGQGKTLDLIVVKVTLPNSPAVYFLVNFLATLSGVILAYLGISAMIGFIRGSPSSGVDLMVIIKIVAIVFLIRLVAPIWDLFTIISSVEIASSLALMLKFIMFVGIVLLVGDFI